MTTTTMREAAREAKPKRPANDPLSHRYRSLLRQVLEAIEAGSGLESPSAMIGVTGSLRGEGVTTVAAGLACAAAGTHRGGALLVDCHLEPSGLEQLFGMAPRPGLADLVHDGDEPEQLLSKTSVDGLSFLSAGSAEMRSRLYDDPYGLREAVRWIQTMGWLTVFDLPPVHENSGPLEVASLLDGVLLVVEADRTAQEVVLASQRRIGRCHGRLLGVVLNKHQQPARHGWFLGRNGKHGAPPPG